MKKYNILITGLLCIFFCLHGEASAQSTVYGDKIYNPGQLKPVDSQLKVRKGDSAPIFILPSITGKQVDLRRYRDKKNVLLTFIPAAWTPVCSDQWPGYNIARPLFEKHDTMVIGISTDNIPTLFAWTMEMGDLWFPVLSDFWPHGAVSEAYGVLRSDGTAERALILIDKKGIIQFTHVSDINIRPDLKLIVDELKKLD